MTFTGNMTVNGVDTGETLAWGNNGNNLATISGITGADIIGGSTQIGFNGINGSISGIVVSEVVPEPSSAALLGLGGLALIFRRRK